MRSSRNVIFYSTFALSSLAAGCAPPSPQETDGPEPVGEAVWAQTVGEAVNGGCSTGSVKGLSLQIIAQAACVAPGSFVEVPEGGNLSFTAPVLPYLEQPAKDALLAALADKPGTAMQINSMLRTVAQQYLLYQWYLSNQCGIGLAAKPGNSNHETGVALDVQQYNTWKAALSAHGFKWYGDADPVHFDYVGPGAVNYKGTDVLALQMLWNKNHPEDVIDEDGAYGPQTEARLKKSPAEGFAIGPDCKAPGPQPDMHLALSFPDAPDSFSDGASAGRADLFVGDHQAVEILLTNKGGSNAANVDIGVELSEPHLTALDYLIETDFGHPGMFEENDANTDAANPAHGSVLGPSFVLKLNAFTKGETKRVTLVGRAESYSIAKDTQPHARFWVKDIPGAYHQDTYDGPSDNVDGSQTFAGGSLQLSAPADIYSHTEWYWDTDRREGWEALGSAEVAAVPDPGVLSITPKESGFVAQSPPLSVSAEALGGVEIEARLSGGEKAYLYFATDTSPELDDEKRFALDLVPGGKLTHLSIDASASSKWTGTITRLALGVVGIGGALEVDSLRIVAEPGSGDGSGGSGGGGGSGGSGGAGAGDPSGALACACDLPGSSRRGAADMVRGLAIVLLGIGILGRRRRA